MPLPLCAVRDKYGDVALDEESSSSDEEEEDENAEVSMSPTPLSLKSSLSYYPLFIDPLSPPGVYVNSSPPVADSSGGEGFPPHSVSHPKQGPKDLWQGNQIL